MERADVTIVGGGIIGLACAAELRRAGVDAVVVLEAEGFGSGSSSRANGGVRAQFTTAVNIAFSLHSIGEFERLAAAYPETFTFHQAGYLILTGDPSKVEPLERVVELQRSLGVATEWVKPERVAELAPVVDTSELAAATFHARDGFLDPWSAVGAMKQWARAEGADLRSGWDVTGIERAASGYRVEGHGSTIQSSSVVVATGVDAAMTASWLGADVPIYPVRRNLAYIHEEPSPLIPMCVDLDSSVLVRREPSGGYVVCYSDPDDPPGRDTSLDPKFLDDVAARIGRRFPTLEGMPIDPKQCWAGLYPETPDHHAIVGALPGAPGAFICGGFGGHGIMHSPAAGRAIAELVTTGRCETFDIHPLRPQRFAEGDLVQETAVF